MAYSPIKQAHADPKTASSHDLTLVRTPSPRLADISFAPLSLSFDDVTGDIAGEDGAVTRADHTESRVSKFLSSMTSSSRQSYDLVEDDDYEIEQITPTLDRHPKTMATTMADTTSPHFAVEDPPIRTASISRQLPLNHPMPDLQSLQGAYVKNVERLEESAERLSMKSSLDGELRRIKYEQRQRQRTTSGSSHHRSVGSGPQRLNSTRSLSNPVANANNTARIGVFASDTFVISPTGSLKSPHSMHSASNKRNSKGSRLSHPLPEPEFEGRPLDLDMSSPKPQDVHDLDPRPIRSPSSSMPSQDERPTTSGSGDTYQQANTLFTDFDGVHFAPDRNARASRRISLTRPPRARDSRAFKEPQPGEEMIYYPAPVPVMLNLPVRLSKMNWTDQEKKRLQALSNIPDEMRKSAAWLTDEEGIPVPNKRNSTLPPQLRASAFFDHRSTTADVQLKDGSAVATLDSILDAAAHAPVSAFTDHPFAGNLGNDFYSSEKFPRKSMLGVTEKKAKRKSSLSNLLKPKRSSGNLSTAVVQETRAPSVTLSRHEDDASDEDDVDENGKNSIAPDADEIPDEEQSNKDEESETDSESQFHPGFSAAPTTLLAELQMRKAQQKSRNRTAVDAFPNGMHSTLLELDTVTQLQQKSRRQKHIKLAWEDKETVDKENFDDDDIPLGVLFPEKEQQNVVNVNRPLGLMEKKELEENEPLSHRRARLRGEPLLPPAPSRSPGFSQQEEDTGKPVLELPDLGGSENGDEGETLAQRKQRMKDRKDNGTSAEFARQISTELGLKTEDGVSKPESKTPDIEETLGQRRKRLQAEAMKNGNRNVSGEGNGVRPALRSKRSLADVLQANPVGYVDPNESKTAKLAMQNIERVKEREAQFLAAQQAERNQAYASRNKFGNGNENGLIQAPVNHYQGYSQPYTPMVGSYGVGNNGAYTVQANYGCSAITNPNVQQSYMHSAMGMANTPMNHPYQQQMAQGYGYQSAVDMGPPLDPKQRARIEGWRQGIT